MTEKKGEQASGSYELDLDDTISDWQTVVKDAIEAAEESVPEELASAGNAPADEDVVVLDGDDDDVVVLDPEEESASASSSAVLLAEPDPEIANRLERLEAENEGLRDRLTRTIADFANYRKRMEREKEMLHKFALFDSLKDFIGVYDNLERALAATTGNADDVKQGVEMIARQFMDMLSRHGVEPVLSQGQLFDPKVHEAVARLEADVEAPTVHDEHQPGYVLHDRLLRAAMVTVAMPNRVAEERLAEERLAEEPVAEEPVAEEPVAEEPVAADEDEAITEKATEEESDESPMEAAAPDSATNDDGSEADDDDSDGDNDDSDGDNDDSDDDAPKRFPSPGADETVIASAADLGFEPPNDKSPDEGISSAVES